MNKRTYDKPATGTADRESDSNVKIDNKLGMNDYTLTSLEGNYISYKGLRNNKILLTTHPNLTSNTGQTGVLTYS